VRPLVGQKLRDYRDKSFKQRRLEALPLPAPLAELLPEAPRVAVGYRDAQDGSATGTVELARSGTRPPRNASPESVRKSWDRP
jgi:hypothetical protein